MDPPAVVIDGGTYEVRAGLAGDDAPRYRAPNCTARPKQQLQVLVADEIYTIKNHAQLEFSRPLERGVLVHAGAQRDVFERCFSKVQCTPRDSRIVVTECAVNPPSARKGLRRDFVRGLWVSREDAFAGGGLCCRKSKRNSRRQSKAPRNSCGRQAL